MPPGWYFDLERHDPPEMLALIDADLARQFAIVGHPRPVRRPAAASCCRWGSTASAANLAAVNRSSMVEGLRETIDGAGQVLELLR